MEGRVWLWLWLAALLFSMIVECVHSKSVDMSHCRDGRRPIELDSDDTVDVTLDGSNWWHRRSCELIFKADDTFDDLQLKFSQFTINDCGVTLKVYSSLSNGFYGSSDDSYSCSNAPLTDWKFTKNRYIKLVVSRDHETTRDFLVKLQIRVAGYKNDWPAFGDTLRMTGEVIAGIIVSIIVLAVICIAVTVWCCCIKSKRSSGTVIRHAYQPTPGGPPATGAGGTSGQQNWPAQNQGVQPSAPYPTLPQYSQYTPQAGAPYPYGYGYPQGGPVPPAYPAAGYTPQPPGYQPSPVEPSAPPTAGNMDLPPPYPGLETTPLKAAH